MKRFKILCMTICLALCGCSAEQPADTAPVTTVTEAETEEATSYTDYSSLSECIYYDEDMFHVYTSSAGEYKAEQEILCGVAPHHLTAGHMIAGLYESAAESRENVDTVVIVAPLHYMEMGKTCTSYNGWGTAFGPLAADTELSQMFADRLGADNNPDLMEFDHAISSHIPFIKYYFPESEVACLLVSPDEKGDFPQKLSDTLYEMSEMKDCLFIFSIDFSHYLSPEEAEKNDRETLEAVLSGDTAAIESFRNDNVDTPYGLSTYVRLSEMLGGEIVSADNSHTQKINGTPYNEFEYPEGVTSYFVFISEKTTDDS